VSSQLATFAAAFSHKDIDGTLITAVQRFVLDFLGVAIGGSSLPSSSTVISLVEELGGQPEATVIGRRQRVPAANAALANGTSAHGLELDDTHEESSLHPGAVVIPTVLAVGEKLGSSGSDVIVAIVVGYEVMARVGMAANPEHHYKRGFHPTGTCGVFGSAVAASKLMELSSEGILSAMGIAGSQASGLLAFLNDGSWTKRFHPGWAAHAGIVAAMLAAKGFKGPADVLEGPHGFLDAYSDAVNLNALTEGLGASFAVLRTSMKPYGCCRYIHPAVDAILELVEKHHIRPDDVEHVEIGLVNSALRLVAGDEKFNPETTVDAQFSMPYTAALAIAKRRVMLDDYAYEALRDDAILSLAKKVHVRHEPEAEKHFPARWPARVRIRTKDGVSREAWAYTAKGSPERPLTAKEVEEKFLSGASMARLLNPKDIIHRVGQLDRLKDIRSLTELLRS